MARRNVAGIRVVEYTPEGQRPLPGGMHKARWGKAEVLVKADQGGNPNLAVNEFLAHRLAGALGVNVPAGDIWLEETETAMMPRWVSLEIKYRGSQLPPPLEATISGRVDATALARLFVFDALIDNGDRRAENILLSEKNEMWAIDHEDAIFRDCPIGGRVSHLKKAKAQRNFDDQGEWATIGPERQLVHHEAEMLSMRLRDASIEEPAMHLQYIGLIDAATRAALVEYLTYRRDNIMAIIENEMANFEQLSFSLNDLMSEGDGDGN